MSNFFGYMDPSEVHDPRTFANYVQQELGTPFPTRMHLNTMGKQAKEFFYQYPDASWQSLCRVVQFCKARKKHPPHCYAVMSQIRYAYAAGYLPEMEPRDRTDEKLEAQIETALQYENDEKWRERLIASTGPDVRRKVFVAWREERLWAK